MTTDYIGFRCAMSVKKQIKEKEQESQSFQNSLIKPFN
jgi:hypothetical protein